MKYIGIYTIGYFAENADKISPYPRTTVIRCRDIEVSDTASLEGEANRVGGLVLKEEPWAHFPRIMAFHVERVENV